MEAERHLLNAVLANRQASEPRQVYADWLDEIGDPRGAVLRLHDWLRQLAPDATAHEPEVTRLRQLVDSLLESNPSVADWLHDLRVFHRPVVMSSDLQSEPRLIVRYYADWAGPCRQFAPTYVATAECWAPWAVFASVNIDLPGMWEFPKAKITAVPTLVMARAGEVVTSRVGVVSLPTLDELIAEFFLDAA
ncbi:MAG: TIGR02996 domain-containing protein [Planctomycetales bacterium]|nr:TIGR02996 domain-containing protein [Planctomycetales bacterium]